MASLAVLAPNPLLRAWLAALLRTMGFDPVEEATDLEDLKRHAKDVRHPEILLISLLQRDLGLDALIQEIKTWAPHAKVVFLAPALDMPALSACFAAGADGYLLEDISRDGLQHSLLLVSAGEKVFPSVFATVLSTAASKVNAPPQTVNDIEALRVEASEARHLASTLKDGRAVTDLLAYALALEDTASSLRRARQ